jgi:AAA+ ATPase superfamily predicted ATPase
LQQGLSEFLNTDYIKDVNFNNWEGLFKLIPDCNNKEKIIIVIDEFQYLCIINKAFPSIFQRIWMKI